MKFLTINAVLLLFFSFSQTYAGNTADPCKLCGNDAPASKPDTTIHYSQEKHLKNIRQLTTHGDYAEAYFSFDDSKIAFQAKSQKWGAK